MIKIKFDQYGQTSIGLDPEWFPFLLKWFGKGPKEESLDYSTAHSKAAYPDVVHQFISIHNGTHEVCAPYILLIDYRDPKFVELGKFTNNGRFILPGELALLRDKEVACRKAAGKLKKRDQPAIRMSDVIVFSDKRVEFTLQEASYYDQVGSNLSVDANLPVQAGINMPQATTAREWDKVQSGIPNSLPPLSVSRLSNTIGVAVGIRVEDNHGRPGIVVRKRGPNVDVYPNMWHLPFSFALSYIPPLPQSGSLQEIINFDYAHELDQETGLEPDEIKDVRAIALCRDLCRAGKPQFFLDLECKLSFEELDCRMKKHNDEFRGSSRLFSLGKVPQYIHEAGSPELLAYICLQSQ